METNGVFAVEDFYYKSSNLPTQNLLTTRLRLDLTKMNDSGTLAFHFDARDRLGSRAPTSTTENLRIDTAFIENNGTHYYLAAGRLLPKGLYVESVDGVNAVYQFYPDTGVGVFGGLRPDPYSFAFNTDFTTGGVYGYYRNATMSGSLAYVYNGYKGGTDRQYIYGQASYNPTQTISIFTTATADINPTGAKPKLVNGIAEVSWRPDFNTGITVGVNTFSSIKFYKSMVYAVDDSRQHSYYLNANYRIYGKYNVYGRVERQHRSASAGVAAQDINSFRAGFNTDNILDSGVSMDINASTSNGYGSTHNTYAMELSRLNWEVFQVVFNASYMQNIYSTTGNDNIIAYGMSGYLYLKKKWTISLAMDREQGKDTVTTRIMSRVALKF